MTEPDPAAAALRRAARSTPKGRPAGPARRTGGGGRDPELIGAALDGLLADNGWRDRAAVATLMAQWGEIVGDDVAAHVQPVAFADGELTLQADSTAWATQVRLLLPTLSQAIARQVGSGTVGRITVLAPTAPSWVAGPRRVKGRGPRDTYG